MYYKTIYPSPIGNLTLASDGNNLTGLWIEGQKYHGDNIYKNMQEKNDLLVFDVARQWLEKYFNKKRPGISDLPLAPNGSVFRHEVWDILCQIPYGEVISYGNIAKKIAFKRNKENAYIEPTFKDMNNNNKVFEAKESSNKKAVDTKKSNLSRAVGGAVGHNPISIIIPCHRVIGTNGNLTGYAAGLKNKIKLLELEGVDISKLHVLLKDSY